MKYGLMILFLLLLMVGAGCTTIDTIYCPEAEDVAKIVTVTVEDQANGTYTVSGTDAETLIEILQNCKYDPMKVCKCLPPILVTLENGEKYGINLHDGYARSRSTIPTGQADLTKEQLQTVTAILEKSIDKKEEI